MTIHDSNTPSNSPEITDPDQRPYDIVIWGASGYTGQLTAEHLARVHGCGTSHGGLRWALAGRDRAKLVRLKDHLVGLDPGARDLPLILADSHDADSLDRLCRQTRVVCATVGPFALHGAELVAACVRQRTHYCDTTGEASFIRHMVDAHHVAAQAAGVCIVHCCGVDSVPSDLGVLLLHDHVKRHDLGSLAEVRCYVTRFVGGLSGGTFASMLNLWEVAARDKQVRRDLADPYGLNDEGQRQGPDRSERPNVFHDPEADQWAGLFLMAPINTRIVRRSNQVQDFAYGPDFRYGEHRGFGPGTRGWLRAQRETVGLAGFFLGASTPPTRWLLRKFLPTPGQGPSAQDRATGRFRFEHYATTSPTKGAAPRRLRAVVAAQCDAYEATGIFAAESALLLARPPAASGPAESPVDPSALPGRTGVLTPASGLGMPLIERLRTQGITLSVD
jgi:short subunit dehydrogenase-like uncharacterized protein